MKGIARHLEHGVKVEAGVAAHYVVLARTIILSVAQNYHQVLYSQHRHTTDHSTMSTLIVDFPAQTRRRATSRSKPTKKKAVHFSITSDIRFYERPDKVHAKELCYSREDMSQFKIANRQVVLDMHMRHLSLANNTEVDARAVFQGCELTGIENLLTPGLVKRTMALKRGCWDAVLDEQEKQDAAGCHDPDRIAHGTHEYSRRTARRSLQIGLMHHVSVQGSCKSHSNSFSIKATHSF